MNPERNTRHHKPHIHARYQGSEASFDIASRRMFAGAGDFPKDQQYMVQAWIVKHEKDLLANWELLMEGVRMEQQDEVRPQDEAISEEERLRLEAQEAIVRLEVVLAVNPNDVGALNELQRAYRVVGDEVRREAVMRRMMAIPSKRDILEMARDLVAAVKACTPDERVDVDRLRKTYAPLFDVVESRREIRPGAVMEAAGCGCTFAVEVLQAFGRLGIVSASRDLGLRDVAPVRPTGVIPLRTVPPSESEFAGNAPYHDRAVTLVRERGPVSAAQLGRLLNVGYARACLIRAQLVAEGVLHDEAR